MDDSHACLKEDNMEGLRDHLNSINLNMLLLKKTTAFLGALQPPECMETKPTQTDRYHDNNSHHPAHEQKRSVVNTLLNRAFKVL